MIGHVLYVTVPRLIPLPGSTEVTNRYLCVASDEPGSGISSREDEDVVVKKKPLQFLAINSDF